MYSNSNKSGSSIDNSITVTPIKVEVSMSQSYPTLVGASSSVAMAATTSTRRPTNPPNMAATTVVTSLPHPAATTTTTSSCPTGATPKGKATKSARAQAARKPPPTIDTFWPNLMAEVRCVQQVDAKHQPLPLARIKKIMKLDENAKMIAAEAPLLFAKACEYFIQELTMRAWIHTEESKRRTLQRSDIALAIANYDQFDFLIDIVPREDIKITPTSHKKETHTPANNNSTGASNSGNLVAPPTATVSLSGGSVDVKMEPEVLHFGTLAQDAMTIGGAATQQQPAHPVHQQQLQIIQQTAAAAHPQQLQYFITIPGMGQQVGGQPQLVQQLHMPQQQLTNGLTPHLTSLNLVAHHQPQHLILTAGPNGQLTATPAPTAAQHTLAAQQQHQHNQQQHQQIQLLQQVVTPNGELTNVPITINANQLNLLRLQMQQQQQQQQQQVLIPTQCLTAQPMLQLQASHNATQAVQMQQQQQQQQHQQQNTADGTNIFLNVPHAVTQAQAQTHSSNSIVSTDRNLGSTFRPNC